MENRAVQNGIIKLLEGNLVCMESHLFFSVCHSVI